MSWYPYFRERFNLTRGTDGWWRMKDPLHLFDSKGKRIKDKALAVNFGSRVVMSFRHDYSTTITKFLMELDGISYGQVQKIYFDLPDEDEPLTGLVRRVHIAQPKLPEGGLKLLDQTSWLATRVRLYLQNTRGLDLNYLVSRGVCFFDSGPHAGYICFPCYEKEELVYYVLRNFMGGMKRYMNPKVDTLNRSAGNVVYNIDALNTYSTCYITEGIIDALTVGPSCAATLRKTLTTAQSSMIIKSAAKELIVLGDPGAYAENLVQYNKIAQYKKVKIVDLTSLGGDVNKVGIASVLKLVYATKWQNELQLI